MVDVSRALPARSRQREVRRPKYLARAKVGSGWQTIGAAWELRNGEEGLSVKLNSIPVGAWEGQFVLIPPLQNGEAPDPEE
ncbi:hypothetical protein CCR97_24155 [Rhodoplanes elegans]|uniref:Uncharacterized protein n=1 Tax=Rhodoplanes elegans TaxID=29408 RepID=A0A327KSU0_9BRAD|nr:hypothetical protein [Rhodoplanes elegans]MBK5961274.1 hypothetical protein [Rhodoplanes elegans]RAI41909.1 hypothetical protein CH338_01575 [Rhodoplanes elegans]